MLLRMVGEILASHWKATALLKLGSPNHSLVWCKIKVLPKKLHRSKHVGKPHIDTTKVQHQRSLRNSQSLLKMLCLQATHATLLTSHGTTCVRQFSKQLLLPLGGRPQRTATCLVTTSRLQGLLRGRYESFWTNSEQISFPENQQRRSDH